MATRRVAYSQETLIAAAAIKALRSLGAECIRVQAGTRKASGGGWSHGATRGTPDWIVVCPFMFLEFKDLSTLSDAQRQWHAWAKRCGISVYVARSVGDAVKAFQAEKRKLKYFESLVIEEPKRKENSK
jgi:hypothetical protein